MAFKIWDLLVKYLVETLGLLLFHLLCVRTTFLILPEGRIWVGDGNTIVSDTVFLDETNGRLGIGTTNPRTALEVLGKIRVWSGANSHTYVETSSGSNLGSIQGKKNSDNAVRSLALNPLGGNVGINLGAGIVPSENLQVQGSARIQADSNNFLKITTSQAATTFANSGNGIASPSMSFNTGADTRLTILGINGNVGIGTTSPSEKLDVVGNIELGDGGTGAALKYNSTNRGTIFVNGSEIMRLEAAGNVGIGTTSPQSKLNINGGTGSLSTGLTFGDGDTGIWEASDDNLRFSTTSTTRMVINSSGNVGIGTTAPSYPLVVARTGSNIVASFESNENAYLRIARTGVSQAGESQLRVTNNGALSIASDSNINIQTGGVSGTSRLYIRNSDGNVGIGTTSPSRKLQVHADSGNAYLQLTQSATGTTSNDGFQISMGASQVNLINRENGSMVFETNNSEKMRITSAGDVRASG